ncbi:hypothetical protein CBS101457_002088 [Exobasidium rhododendri]|nr:hypothetical protein CBS101457_002088 [Exobasidium rhododendri]
MVERKKRTRPISACENCSRLKKIKCILKHDEPICESCSSNAKECLFRVDDLSSALRLERFADYGPPSGNARQIATSNRKPKAPPSDQRRGRTSSSSLSSSTIAVERNMKSGEKWEGKKRRASNDGEQIVKTKAVFRSFANPTKLGAPSRLNARNATNTRVQIDQRMPPDSFSASRSYFASTPPFHTSRSNYSPQSFTPQHMLMPEQQSYGSPWQSQSRNQPAQLPLQPHGRQEQRISNEPAYSQSPLPSFRSAFPSLVPSPKPSVLPPPLYAARSTIDPLVGRSALLQDKPATKFRSTTTTPSRNDLAASNVGEDEDDSVVKGREHDPFHDQTKPFKEDLNGTRHPPTFKKIALPFFRWFGATANTPGIRKIKVGVYHETDLEEDHAEMAVPMRQSASPPECTDVSALTSQSAIADDSPDMRATTSSDSTVKITSRTAHPAGDSALSTTSRDLFESDRPRYPRQDVLIHLVRLFIKYFKASCFPWLDEEELRMGAQSGELPAILANAICAITARFSNHADLQRHSTKGTGEPFADMAKVLIIPMLSWPSVEVIEALVIISYSEFAAGADSGLWMYIGMSIRMATDLGLQHEVTINSMANKKQQDRARLLFWAIVGLDRITCFGTGRPVTVREDSFDCELPPLEVDPLSNGFVFGHIVRTLVKRGRIGELLNRKSDSSSLEERGRKLQTMWLDLAEYYDSLPSTLHFGVNTFRKLAAANQGAAFVYLHVLLQSTMSLLNRPSLLRRFDKDFTISAPSKLASIANHACGTIVSILRFAEDARRESILSQESREENPLVNPYIDCNPYLDQLILPAGRAFLTEREAIRDALRRLGYTAPSRPVSRGGGGNVASGEATPNSILTWKGSASEDGPFTGLISNRQYAQTNLVTCQKILDRLALWWSGASWPARALHQESSGASSGDDGEYEGNDEDAQPAPIRDVEMVLKWAKARVKKGRVAPSHPAASHAVAPLESHRGSCKDDERNKVPPSKEFKSILDDHYVDCDSSFGLGFSGSFGTTSDIDIQALIDAWANEENFIDATMQVHAGTTKMSAPLQDWGGDAVPFSSLPQVISSLSPSLQSNTSKQQSMTPAQNNDYLPSPFSEGLDLNAMQFEEFFYRSNLGNEHAASSSEPLQLHVQPYSNPSHHTALEASVDDLSSFEDLPNAFFNTFAYHAGTQERTHSSSLSQKQSKQPHL